MTTTVDNRAGRAGTAEGPAVRRIGSPLGPMTATANAAGVTALGWNDESATLCVATRGARGANETAEQHLDQLERELAEYFVNPRMGFTVPLAPRGTAFQRRVWDELGRIAVGTVISYQELARRVSDQKASRAVGAANGKNPIAIVVPCHRVIAADGGLCGFAAGLERKRWLLTHEGVTCTHERGRREDEPGLFSGSAWSS